MDNEPRVSFEKSRTMMGTWFCSAWTAHKMFTKPFFTVIFQSEDEARAIKCVSYVRALWKHSIPALQERWPHDHRNFEEPYNAFHMKNGSWCKGFVGNPDKIRSEHPSCVVFDEAAHMTQYEQAYNVAVPTGCKHLFSITSANPGDFRNMTQWAKPVPWPEYANQPG